MARPRLDAVLILAASLALATSAPLAKAAAGLDPLALAAGRCLIAAAGLALVARHDLRRALASLDRAGRRSLIGAGAALAAHFALFLGGLATTSLTAAVALVSLEPLAIVLTAWVMFRIRPAPRELAGVGLAMTGALIVAGGAGQGENRLLGDLLVFASTVVYGLYVAAARKLREDLPALPYAASVYAVAGALLAPVAVVRSLGAPVPPLRSVGWLVMLGLVPTLVGHTLVQRAARRLSPSFVALVSPGETAGALAIGALLQGTWPSTAEWGGVGLILAGVLLALSTPVAASDA